jgi:hypothetical protein
MCTRIGRVVRCPECSMTTFEEFRFDGRRDPLPGGHPLVDVDDVAAIRELLDVMIEIGGLVQRTCLSCAMGVDD